MAWEHGEVSIVINRPVEEVFAYAESVENLPHWAGVQQAQVTAGRVREVGSRLRIVTNVLGKKMEADSELVAFEPNRLSKYRNITPFPSEITMIYERVGGKTKVTRRLSGEPGGVFKAAYPLMRKKLSREAKRMMENLKSALERRVQAAR